jgi:hypothetical protein
MPDPNVAPARSCGAGPPEGGTPNIIPCQLGAVCQCQRPGWRNFMGTHSQIRLKNAVKLHEMLMAFQVLAGIAALSGLPDERIETVLIQSLFATTRTKGLSCLSISKRWELPG